MISVIGALGLAMQLMAVSLVVWRVGRKAIAHVGALFVFMAAIFHGLTELIQLMFPGLNPYRTFVDPDNLNNWILLVSAALLVFAGIYTWALRPTSVNVHQPEQLFADDIEGRIALSWPTLLLVTVPAYAVSISASTMYAGYWVAGLSSEFLLFLVVLCALSFAVKHPSLLAWTLLVQCALIALVGERLLMLITCVMLLSALARYRIMVNLRHVLVAVAAIGLLAIIISTSRAVVGREALGADASTRVQGLLAGAVHLTDGRAGSQSILTDFVYRFDGNSFGSMVYGQLRRGTEPAGMAPLVNNVALMVPSFLNAHKLSVDDFQREEELYLMFHYGFPLQLDYLPTTLGTIFGFFGAAGLLLSAACLGYGFALTDRWLQRSRSTWSLLIGLGLTYAVVFMERGTKMFFLMFRGVLVLWVFLAAIRVCRRVLLEVAGRPKKLVS